MQESDESTQRGSKLLGGALAAVTHGLRRRSMSWRRGPAARGGPPLNAWHTQQHPSKQARK